MRNPRRLLGFAAAFTLAAAGAARGETPLPAGVPDLVGARSLALGAYRGVVAGNDGIYLNAASLAARQRYSIEAGWLLDRDGGSNALQVYDLSVVDSQTTGVTSGLAYTRVFSGPWIGNLLYVPLALPVTNHLFLGVTGKYQSLNGPMGESTSAINADASGFWRSDGGFALGVSGYNLLDSGHTGEQPRALGVGVSYGDDHRFNVAADWRGDFQRRGKLTSLLALGGELLLGDTVPIRASYVKDETRFADFWSVGAGLVSSSGLAIDAAYRQCIENPADRTFAVTLKLFLSSH